MHILRVWQIRFKLSVAVQNFNQRVEIVVCLIGVDNLDIRILFLSSALNDRTPQIQ